MPPTLAVVAKLTHYPEPEVPGIAKAEKAA
jgi:hypothetical protein